jgi:putative tryptophan/tyrosine transport system substrate-binding protein
MHELVPTAAILAFLANPTNQGTAVSETKALKAAAGALGVQLLILHATRSAEIESIYASLTGQRVGGLIVSGDILFVTLRDKLFALAEKYKVPAIYHYAEYARAGGLMGYGTKTANVSRIVGIYVGRILKGERPADLPIQQATEIELTINLKTAKTLGLTFPTALLALADEVIE